MKRERKIGVIAVFLFILVASAMQYGCGSANKESDGTTTTSEAATVGISNCLTCHNPATTLVQDWMNSRHGNHMLAAAKLPNDTETPGADPSPSSCAYECHDPFNDRDDIDLAYVQSAADPAVTDWSAAASFIGCEGCHGGGQSHNGIPAGIPYATPGPRQCGQCHYLNDDLAKPEWVAEGLYPHHTTSSSGNNVRRNITDSHVDDPATGYGLATNIIEGYVIRTSQQNGCVDCHFKGHKMDLTINYQWGNSAHGGHIKAQKDAALAAGLPGAIDDATRLQLLADVTAAGADSSTGDAWLHYNWDDRASRGSCQVCHTATGIANFLSDPASYDTSGAGNDYSHLSGWTPTQASGQNEMLYCWGCHSDSKGTLRNPGPIPTVYTYTPTSAGGFSTTTVNVTFPEARKSNVCVRCHGGRGNNDIILANVQDADYSTTDSVNRSTRAAEHHAPTAASLFAAQTHSGYEYAGQDYTGAPTHASIDIGSTGYGPCVNCHMGGSTEAAASQKDHTFEATEHDGSDNITTIFHLTTCNTAACHISGMSVSVLEGKKDGFADAKAVLAALMNNSVTNYLGLNISTTSNNNYRTVAVNAYGALMNQLYFTEDPCAYVHNSRYSRRLLFDSIDWMQDGDLDGTIDISGFATGATAAAFLKPGDPATAVTRP
jgi:hypothetical protein